MKTILMPYDMDVPEKETPLKSKSTFQPQKEYKPIKDHSAL